MIVTNVQTIIIKAITYTVRLGYSIVVPPTHPICDTWKGKLKNSDYYEYLFECKQVFMCSIHLVTCN